MSARQRQQQQQRVFVVGPGNRGLDGLGPRQGSNGSGTVGPPLPVSLPITSHPRRSQDRTNLGRQVQQRQQPPSRLPPMMRDPSMLLREFTFTGYSILEDDGQEPESTDTQDVLRRRYETSCRRFGVVPASTVNRSFGRDRLHMRGRPLGPQGTKAVAVSLRNSELISSICIPENNILDDGLLALCDMVNTTKRLRELDLSSNGLGERGLAGLCSALLENSSLARLDLSHNSITDREAAFVCKLLENNIHLKQLNLSKNAIECNDGRLESALGYNDTLEVLDLSWNRIREDGANSLTKGLYANNGLKDLDLSWNGFSDRSCPGLAAALRKNFVLEKLRLRHNRMSGRSALTIVQTLQQNSNLTTLDVGYNPIESKDTTALLDPFLKGAVPASHGIKDVDLSGVSVPPEFLANLARLQTGRLLRVTYGCVAATDGVRQGQTSFNNRRHQLVERTFEHVKALRIGLEELRGLFAAGGGGDGIGEASAAGTTGGINGFIAGLQNLQVPLSDIERYKLARYCGRRGRKLFETFILELQGGEVW